MMKAIWSPVKVILLDACIYYTKSKILVLIRIGDNLLFGIRSNAALLPLSIWRNSRMLRGVLKGRK